MRATIHKVDPSLFQLQFDSRSRLATFLLHQSATRAVSESSQCGLNWSDLQT